MTVDIEALPLSDRARLAALVETSGDDDLRLHLLGALGRPAEPARALKRAPPPSAWTQVHVLDRLEEAFSVLSALPAKIRPAAYGNSMPQVVCQHWALRDRFEMGGELEEDKNRVRLAPSAAQISRMDQALRWPVEHLASSPEVSLALCRRALWAAKGFDIGRCCRKLALNPKFFSRQWQHGLTIVTMRLVAKRIPVS